MGRTEEENKAFKLRKKAEKIVSNKYRDAINKSWDMEEIIHELRVHQTELELQNEDLKETQIKLEKLKTKYFDLYNLAPVGYFTINGKGLIIDANLIGTSMLEIEIKYLYKSAFIKFVAHDYRNKYYHLWKDATETGYKQTAEIQMITNKGNTFCAHIESIFNIINNELKIAIFDVSDRKNAEIQLTKSLEEKEVLIREIHHRVKNNLQIIASLLHLQESCVEGEEYLNVLKESELRVKSMAIIHEKVYQSTSLNDINFKEYIEKLIYDIFYTYGVPKGTINIILNIEDINLNIDTTIP